MTFSADSGAEELSERLAKLTPEKRELFERALLAKRRASLDDERIPRRSPTDPSPLSFSQQRLWFFDRLDPGNPTYNACVGMQLTGVIEVDVLRRAFAVVVERHEILRTVYPDVDAVPEQHVLREHSLRFIEIDISDLDEAQRSERVAALVAELPRAPYDLRNDLPMRVALIKVAAEERILLLMEHHIAFDGWSDEILCDEVAECYQAELSGTVAKLPDLTVQYRDFAAWQHRRLVDERLHHLQSFWRNYLDGAPALAALPADHPRPDIQSFDGARVYIDLPGDLLEMVHYVSRANNATPFMVFLAAFEVLLTRWAGLADITIGTPIASRSRVELERLIGFFSNTLVVRGSVGLDDTFTTVVQQTRTSVLAAFEHQELPFDKIVEAVQPQRNSSHNPLFQINFRVTSGGDALLALPGVNAEPYSVDIGFARFDLALELQQLDDRIGGYLEYNVALFDERTARALVDAFGVLVRELLTRTEVSVRDLAMALPSTGPSIRRARRG